MKQLNLYYLGGGGGGSTPDGRTITPTDDVEIWLSCAGISGTGYTTVAEVIADTGVLTSVLGSDNANDYLARSTTFASDICADSLAMTTIGQNNYASNALINNSTWINAIVDSTYMEQILNVSVPKMTGYTTPSGVVSASSELNASNAAWKAFDKDFDYYNNLWHSASANAWWICYQFPEPKKICALVLHTGRHSGPSVSDLQVSNDGSTWTSVGAFVNCPTANTFYKKAYIISDKYAYYKLNITASNYSGYAEANEIEFFGREDV